ncbi:MAG: hypothetical protein H7099_06075 [Gemmatimonadaceae bacterium]|nr:hypothetical protein [Gemmatimonadaceae bacterium]
MSRILVGIALLVGGLLGLFMTACGGIFTASSFGGGSSGIQGVQIMSVPSLICGLLLLRFVWRRTQKWRSPPPV